MSCSWRECRAAARAETLLTGARVSGTAGLLVKLLGWEHFFLISAAAAVPAFLLMVLVTPWGEDQARGAYAGE